MSVALTIRIDVNFEYWYKKDLLNIFYISFYINIFWYMYYKINLKLI